MSRKCPGRGHLSKRRRQQIARDRIRRVAGHRETVRQAVARVKQEIAAALLAGGWHTPDAGAGVVAYEVYSHDGKYLGKVVAL